MITAHLSASFVTGLPLPLAPGVLAAALTAGVFPDLVRIWFCQIGEYQVIRPQVAFWFEAIVLWGRPV